jgi:hypothetical protein
MCERHLVRLYKLVVVLIAFAAGSNDLVAAHFSMGAMACCAKTHNECAKFRTADDCCRSMGRGVSATTSMLPDGRADHGGVTLAILPIVDIPAAVAPAATSPTPAFKRPHDPPHLHPVPLLI